MGWLTDLRVFLAGLAIRIGIPVGIMLLVAWLLRRLDSKSSHAE